MLFRTVSAIGCYSFVLPFYACTRHLCVGPALRRRIVEKEVVLDKHSIDHVLKTVQQINQILFLSRGRMQNKSKCSSQCYTQVSGPGDARLYSLDSSLQFSMLET
jgi:hypothetical protein